MNYRQVRLTISPPSMSRFSRQCGILNISKLYRPQRPVTGIALVLFLKDSTPVFKHAGITMARNKTIFYFPAYFISFSHGPRTPLQISYNRYTEDTLPAESFGLKI
jgi:hypothetical protein